MSSEESRKGQGKRDAYALIEKIVHYWAKHGYSLLVGEDGDIWIERTGFLSPVTGEPVPYWSVRSTMINGLPKDYKPQEELRVRASFRLLDKHTLHLENT